MFLIYPFAPDGFVFKDFDVIKAIRKVCDDAAGNGHLKVVKFMVQHATEKSYDKWIRTDALAQAISNEHAFVIEFLLTVNPTSLEGSFWNVINAFVTAVNIGQSTLADRIFKVHLDLVENDLFVELAGRDGCTKAVKYLYDKEQNSAMLVNDAFINFADRGCIDTMKFLLDTGFVPSRTFKSALEITITSPNKTSMEVVAFLCSKKRVTSTTINKWINFCTKTREYHEHRLSLLSSKQLAQEIVFTFVTMTIRSTS